jgi:hypothetical protein
MVDNLPQVLFHSWVIRVNWEIEDYLVHVVVKYVMTSSSIKRSIASPSGQSPCQFCFYIRKVRKERQGFIYLYFKCIL